MKIQSLIIISSVLLLLNCKPEPEPKKPTISLLFESGMTTNGAIVEIGAALKFKLDVNGEDINITNFNIKKVSNGVQKTVLDSGLNSNGFTLVKTFYQGVEDQADWVFTVMDRERNIASTSILIKKDPNSRFGGIVEFPEIVLGYQQNIDFGHFFLPSTGNVYFQDSATIFQSDVDILTYFYESASNGVLLQSPTLSSPNEESNAAGDLYTLYYPFLVNWTTRNYTKYDIRVDNGVSLEEFENAHNDSLLIVSYDDVWGKKKYKWANPGLIIPFETAAGKKGLIKVLEADTVETGKIKISIKMQI